MRRFLPGLLLSCTLLAQSPNLTPPVNKTFTLTRTYRTRVALYRQPALVDLVDSGMQPEAMKPEQVLAAQEHAAWSGNFEAYLETFNDTSRAKILSALQSSGKTAAQWSAEHKLRLPDVPRLRLIQWVARRPYVLISYEVIADNQQQPVERKVAVFRISGEGLWKANLDLEQDPVYQAMLQGKTEINDERPVR